MTRARRSTRYSRSSIAQLRMRELAVGTMFSYRIHPRWRFWRRRWGVAQVIGEEDSRDLLHLRVFGMDGSVVSHLPIRTDCVLPFVEQVFDASDAMVDVDEDCRRSITTWRAAQASGVAGVFDLPIGEAISKIEETLPPEVAKQSYHVESAYPVRAEDREFRNVRVIVAATE